MSSIDKHSILGNLHYTELREFSRELSEVYSFMQRPPLPAEGDSKSGGANKFDTYIGTVVVWKDRGTNVASIQGVDGCWETLDMFKTQELILRLIWKEISKLERDLEHLRVESLKETESIERERKQVMQYELKLGEEAKAHARERDRLRTQSLELFDERQEVSKLRAHCEGIIEAYKIKYSNGFVVLCGIVLSLVVISLSIVGTLVLSFYKGKVLIKDVPPLTDEAINVLNSVTEVMWFNFWDYFLIVSTLTISALLLALFWYKRTIFQPLLSWGTESQSESS